MIEVRGRQDAHLVKGGLDALDLDGVAHAELLLGWGWEALASLFASSWVGSGSSAGAGSLAEDCRAFVSPPLTRAKPSMAPIPIRTSRTAARPRIRGSARLLPPPETRGGA